MSVHNPSVAVGVDHVDHSETQDKQKESMRCVTNMENDQQIKACSEDRYSDDEEEYSEDSDDAGSLVDFIVDDALGEDGDTESECSVESGGGDESENDEAGYNSSSTRHAAPLDEEAKLKKEMDGIDAQNIISGKRKRVQTITYEQELFSSNEYKRMLLCDIPQDDIKLLQEEGSGSDSGEASDNEGSEWECESDTSGISTVELLPPLSV
jgi:hypothetical protein